MYLARWHVTGNPEKEQLFKLEKTLLDYKKHLERFAGDKLEYFEYDEL